MAAPGLESAERRAEQVFGSLLSRAVRRGADNFTFKGGDGQVWQGDVLRDESGKVVFTTASTLKTESRPQMHILAARSVVVFNSGDVPDPVRGANTDYHLTAAEFVIEPIRPH